MPHEFSLAHFSDTHLGYEAYSALAPSGLNQRGEDITRAFSDVVADIVAADPPLVIHSGDVAEHPRVANRLMVGVMAAFSKIASIRPDGTRRQLVVVAGNHELPRARKEACFLELYRNLPGVHIVTSRYERICFDHTTGPTQGCDPALDGVVAHCIPHDTLKDLASGATATFDEVTPVPGTTNVLVAHGVAGGSSLYLRTLGREFPIPSEVLARAWDYGALGHWHLQGPVSLAAGDARARCWYAGSTENMGFGDLVGNTTAPRGWLSVRVQRGELPDVTPRPVPIRSMHRLGVVDATDLTPEQLTAALCERLASAAAAGTLANAVVGQVVTGLTREQWGLCDLASVRTAAASALHYEVTPRYGTSSDAPERTPVLGGMANALDDAAAALPERLRAPALELARSLVRARLDDATAHLLTGDDEDASADAQGAATESPSGAVTPATETEEVAP